MSQAPRPAAAVDAGAVRSRVEDARVRIEAAGGGGDVTLVAVTKGFGPEAATAALAAGVTDLGENYAQELVAKSAHVPAARWHLLGAVQRNKVPSLAPLVALWQAVERPQVLDAIAARSPGAAVLVEVELTGAPNRHGCRPDAVAALVDHGRGVGLDVRGLMTVAPAGDRDAARRCFAATAALADRLGLAVRSMGMSDDYDLAVAEGSTMVRLGRALFGARPARAGRPGAHRPPM